MKKRNEFKLQQTRNLVLTASALYNFKNKQLKRRIPLEQLQCVTLNTKTDEFILHVLDERDYLLRSAQRQVIIERIDFWYLSKTKKCLVYYGVKQDISQYSNN